MENMKKKILQMLKEEMRGLMSNDRMETDLPSKLKDKKMKKVTVMSDSEEGVAEGLDKAKELISSKDKFKEAFMNRDSEDSSDDMSESEEESMEEEMPEGNYCQKCGKKGCKMACGGIAKK